MDLPSAENWRCISSCTNGSSAGAPRACSDRTASLRNASRVPSVSPANASSSTTTTVARSPWRRGASNNAVIGAGVTTNDPAVCSCHASTTPRRRNFASALATAGRTTGTPPSLWFPRPVMTSTSRAFATCRSRRNASARRAASSPVGRLVRRSSVFSRPKRSSSNAAATAGVLPVGPRDAPLFRPTYRFLQDHAVDGLCWLDTEEGRQRWRHVHGPHFV